MTASSPSTHDFNESLVTLICNTVDDECMPFYLSVHVQLFGAFPNASLEPMVCADPHEVGTLGILACYSNHLYLCLNPLTNFTTRARPACSCLCFKTWPTDHLSPRSAGSCVSKVTASDGDRLVCSWICGSQIRFRPAHCNKATFRRKVPGRIRVPLSPFGALNALPCGARLALCDRSRSMTQQYFK